MRQKILKALANPPRIFYVPYSLAILNFLICFSIFIVFMIIMLVFNGLEIPIIAPIIFITVLIITHSILAFYSKKDQQIFQIIMSSISLFSKKIPRKLTV
ncbi:MAG: VirB3 family type IV secretion system protein [Alphaproteobacteria bacterium]|nr:VirB3 family type IV secretion system protein [Alphaproteobacteria bacterium]